MTRKKINKVWRLFFTKSSVSEVFASEFVKFKEGLNEMEQAVPFTKLFTIYLGIFFLCIYVKDCVMIYMYASK